MGIEIAKAGSLSPKNTNTYGISGIIVTGVSTSAGQVPCALNTTYKIRSLSELEKKYGIDQYYDVGNGLLVWYHISEFFRLAGNGTDLYFRMVANTTNLQDNGPNINAIVSDSNGAVRQVGITRVPNSTYPADVDPIDEDVLAAIPVMQAIAEAHYNAHRPFQILIEGRNINTSAVTLTVLQDLAALTCNKVSVIVAQDLDYIPSLGASSLPANIKHHAAVGTALGSIAGRQLHERISKVANGNIATSKRWLNPGFSNNRSVKTYEDEIDAIEALHYVFARQYFGKAGTFWQKGLTCSGLTDPEHNIEIGKILDESSRVLYTSLLEYWDDDKELNGDGTPTAATIDEMELVVLQDWSNAIGKSASNLTVTIDPQSDLVNPPQELKVAFQLQPKGYIGKIAGTLTFVAQTT
jgi:hypothetical protein